MTHITSQPNDKKPVQSVHVQLSDRSYPIMIGTDLLGDPQYVVPHIGGCKQILVVSNTTVAPLYLERCRNAFSGFDIATVILPDGEAYKDLDHVTRIYDALLENRFTRRCVLVALGGGVVGDMTGFAAATYQRGVSFIQIPTTLLAQVDSSVGGKTGVNHPKGKNMIGAFHQPLAVIADTQTLSTLPERELYAGLAEVIKYGLIRDAAFFVWLEQNITKLLERDADTMRYAIERACVNKAEVVALDERESGVRATLNLGHTFGHAIEASMGYGTWLHGEAVAAGMAMAATMSQRLGWLDDRAVSRTLNLLKAARLPTAAPKEITVDRFIDFMAVDKKVVDKRIRLVLLKGIGEAVIADNYDLALLMRVISECREVD